MKAAVVQMASGPVKSDNVRKAAVFVKDAIGQGAEFIALPEVFNYRGPTGKRSDLKPVKEPIPGESLKPLMALAKEKSVFILAGSIFETIKNSAKVYNTSVLIDRNGKVAANYRKKYLFDADLGEKQVRESYCFAAGKKLTTVQVGDFRLGMSICFDLRFPELFREYAAKGVNVFTVPSAFTKMTGQAHWEVLLRARAVENLCYVIAPNQIGPDARGVVSYGNSMIVDPWGKILAWASDDKEEIIYAEIEMNVLQEKRKILPTISKVKSQKSKIKSSR